MNSTTHTQELEAVQYALVKNGVLAVIEQQVLWIYLDANTAIATGDEGWLYGTVYRLVDNCWEPDTNTVAEIASVTESDSEQIANEWTDFVQGWRANA